METTGPSGDYGVDDVTVTIHGEPITKGPGAKGAFVHIGKNGTHIKSITGADGSVSPYVHNDLRTPMTITLTGASPSNALLSKWRNEAKVSVRVERRQGQAVVLDTSGWVEPQPPQKVGHDELRWALTVMS